MLKKYCPFCGAELGRWDTYGGRWKCPDCKKTFAVATDILCRSTDGKPGV